MERDAANLARFQKGKPGFYEFGLAALLRYNIAAERLQFTDHPVVHGMHSADVVFIAVNTPQHEAGAADTGDVLLAAEHIVAHLPEGFRLMVVKSTVPLAPQSLTDEIAVMQSGTLVEQGSVLLLENISCLYTRALLDSVPQLPGGST